MSEPLDAAIARVTAPILDSDALVRAIASGRRRGEQPRWRRVELRYVDLRDGRALQVTAYDDRQAHTANHPVGDAATGALASLLSEPFGNWHVDTATETHQLRVTKKGDAVVHSAPRVAAVEAADRPHDREKARLLPEDDPVFAALGLADRHGRIKPSRQAKYRQVEELLRILDAGLTDAMDAGHLRRPTEEDPLRVVDLGCGNAYLTLAANRYLTAVRGLPVRLVGVDRRAQPRWTDPRSSTRSAARRSSSRGRSSTRSWSRHPRWCWPCTRATPPRTRRSLARSGGDLRWCSPRPAATTTSPSSCAARRRRRRTPC